MEAENGEKNTIMLYNYIKRGIDIIIAMICLFAFSPFFLIISISIAVQKDGPILFKHERIGKNGKRFLLWKYRTMVINAEDMLNNFDNETKKEFEKNYKLKEDPRVTKIGVFLRKTNLDELPQFINVLKGDLSIIGPRPIIEEELEKYSENKKKFLSVKPGVIGNWVINRTPETTYEERIKMELYYVENFSWKLDIKIFFKILFKMFTF